MITNTIKKLSSGTIYNTSDFTGGSSYRGGSEQYITLNTDFDETQFVHKTGDVITGDLVMEGTSRIIFQNGSTQDVAFDEVNIQAVSEASSRLANITVVGTKTILTGDLQVAGDVIINDNQIAYSKVNGLSSDLNTITTNATNNTTSINNNITRLNNLDLYNVSNDTDITNINTSLNAINTSVLDIETLNITQTALITQATNNISNIDLEIIDILNELATQEALLTTHTGEIGVLALDSVNVNALITTSQNDITTINNSILDINAVIITNNTVLTGDITTLNNDVININTNITSQDATISTINNSLTNTITELATLNTTHINDKVSTDTHMDTIDATLTSLNTSVNNNALTTSQNTSEIYLNNTAISNLNNTIVTKQNLININNLLDCQYLGYGSITNAKFDTLSDIITNKSIQTQINEIKTNVLNLTGLENIDIADIDQLQLDVTSLNAYVATLQAEDTTQSTINTTITNQLIAINTSIQALITKDASLTVDIADTNNTITTNETNNALLITNLTNSITELNSSITTINTSVGNIENVDIVEIRSDIVGLTTTTTTLQSEIDTNLTSINSINTDLTQINADVSAIQTYDTQNTIDIQAIQTSVALLNTEKQDVIDGTNKLNISNVNLTTSSLEYVDINSSLQAELNILTNNDVAHQTALNTNAAAIATLVSADTLHQSGIDTNTAEILTLQTSKQDTLSALNKLSSTLIETAIDETLTDKIISIDAAIGLKQNEINNLNKLSLADVDITGSSLEYVDIIAPLQSQLTSINNTISTLTTLQNGDVASFQAIEDNFTVVENNILLKQDIISGTNKLDASLIGDGSVSNIVWSYLSTVDANIQTQVNNLEVGSNAYHSITYDGLGNTTIADNTILATLKFGDLSEQTTAYTSAKDTELTTATSNITSAQTDISVLQTDVTTAQNDILLKQDIISGTNKVLITNVDLTGSTLVNCDITAPLQSQLTGLTTSITALQNEDTAQNTLNTQLTTDINALQTGKNDVIDVNNKVSASYISYNASDVNTELGSLNTGLNLKADLSNPTFTGTVSGINKTMVGLGSVDNTTDALKPVSTAQQTALNLKANIANPTFTGLVTTPSIKVSTGATDGYVLTSDATGNGLWSAPSGGGALTYINATPINSLNSMVSGTPKLFGQITLSAGTWLVNYRPVPYNGSGGSGTCTRAQFCISLTTESLTQVSGTSIYDSNISYTVTGNTGIFNLPTLTTILTVTSETIYYFNLTLTFASGAFGPASNPLYASTFNAIQLA